MKKKDGQTDRNTSNKYYAILTKNTKLS